MADDTPQRMIDAMKREQQPQAFAKRYKNYEEPRDPDTGLEMTDEQRTKWRASIDEREAIPAQIQRKLPRWAKDYVQDPIEDMKETAIEGGKAVGEALIHSATVIPRTKAAIAADPEGAKEFAGRVMSGDREAIKATATEASEGAAEPFATMGDATLGGMALQEGKYGEAARYGVLLLLPATFQTLGKSMSKGWLKSAAKAGEQLPDEAAKKLDDLAKRVDEGKVTDEMQIRREIAMIEDAYKAEYMQSKPLSGGGRANVAAGGGINEPVSVGRGRFHDNPGFIAKANREGYSIDDLQKGNEFLTAKRNRLKAEIDDLTAEIKEGKSPLIISSSNKRDRLKNQLEMIEGKGGRYYDEATNSISLDTVLRFRKQADGLKIDFTPIQQAGLADFDLAVDLGNSLERAQVDDLLKPDYDKNPALSFIREGFEEIPSSPDQKNMKVMYEALSDLFDEVVADPRLFREQVYQGVSPDFAQKRMSARLDKKYNKILGDKGLKEDMRRMAQLEQGAQIESGRVRQSRTPGAPGASGKIPEGTSRAERKGTVRERPKKK